MAVIYFRVLCVEPAVAAFDDELCEQLLVQFFLKLGLDRCHRSSKHYKASRDINVLFSVQRCAINRWDLRQTPWLGVTVLTPYHKQF